MFESIFESLLVMLMLGALLYSLFSHHRFQRDHLPSEMALGCVFGLTVIALLHFGYPVQDGNGSVNGVAGPLILSAYIGGIVVGVVSILSSSLLRLLIGGDFATVGVFVQIAYVLTGLLLRHLLETSRWPAVPRSFTLPALAGFAVVQVMGTAGVIVVTDQPPSSAVWLTVMQSSIAGASSILLTCWISNKAAAMALLSRRNGELARQMSLASKLVRIGTHSLDTRSNRVMLEQSLIDLYGLDIEPGLHTWEVLLDRIHPEYLPRFREFMARIREGEEDNHRIEVRARHADGTWMDMQIVTDIEKGLQGQSDHPVSLHMDVTAIRQQADERNRLIKKQEQLAQTLPGTILQTRMDASGPIETVYVSDKCTEYWGYTAEELHTDPTLLLKNQPPEDIVKAVEALRYSSRTGLPIRVRVRAIHRDGTRRWVDMHAQATPIETDGSFGASGYFLDVSAEVAALDEAMRQRELAFTSQKNEAIGQLTGGIAHDFNNMLAVVLGSLELLREQPDSPNRMDLYEEGIEAAMRGAELTRSLLAFARNARLQPEILDLNRVALQSKNWMRRGLPESIEVETSLLGGLWAVEADAASIESALLNLLLNARDAMQGHGRLTVETANIRLDQAYVDSRGESLMPGRYVMLAVSDTGCGISERDMSRIFEPFYTTRADDGGSGMGLAMVEGFVKQSGGTVQVYSEEGVGTTFKLYFPAVDRDRVKDSSDEMENRPRAVRSRVRILLAEDQQAVQRVLVTALQNAGFEVVALENGDRALERFREDSDFDLLVTDIVMPGELQGTHLAREIRSLKSEMPVIFMSGFAAEATVNGNGLRPEDIRLMKPVRMAELIDAVNRALS